MMHGSLSGCLSKVAAAVFFAAIAFADPAGAQPAGQSKGEIKVGNVAAYSGPASAYAEIAKTEAAYIDMLNDKGGINGRKIRFISYDDAFSPPKAVEQTRKLVESDNVLFVFGQTGSSSAAAVVKYLNANKVPQVMVASGATRFYDPVNSPWTTGFAQSPYRIEAGAYARYILEKIPNAKVAILYQNDEFGKDFYAGFKDVLGDRFSKLVVGEAAYDLSDPTIDTHVIQLKASGADVLVDFTTPRFAALVIRKLSEIGWKPVHMLGSVSNSISAVLEVAGLDRSVGIISANSFKDPSDLRWKDDPGVKNYLAFMSTRYKSGNPGSALSIYGYTAAQILQKILEQCGDDLSRENVRRQAASLKNFAPDMLLPGITVNTSPTNYFPIRSVQLVNFNGKTWQPLGPLVHETGASR